MRRPALAAAILALAGCRGGPETRLENGEFDLRLGDATVRYAVHGRGPVLMTLPNSWGLSHAGLRGMYRPLEEHLTMVYFDPRGMGGSSPIAEDADCGAERVRQDFDALRRHLGIERANVIGWSNGAMNLILLAAERPETLERAVFLHGTARFGPEDVAALTTKYPGWGRAYEAYLTDLARPGLDDAARDAMTRTFSLEVGLLNLFADRVAGRRLLADVFRDAQFSWRHSAYSEREWPTFDARAKLASIRARSLVLAGAHDMLPPDRVREIADGIPGARCEVFATSGHFAPLEEPEAFVRTVVEFVGASDR
jgi:proline iminopeptidase